MQSTENPGNLATSEPYDSVSDEAGTILYKILSPAFVLIHINSSLSPLATIPWLLPASKLPSCTTNISVPVTGGVAVVLAEYYITESFSPVK